MMCKKNAASMEDRVHLGRPHMCLERTGYTKVSRDYLIKYSGLDASLGQLMII